MTDDGRRPSLDLAALFPSVPTEVWEAAIAQELKGRPRDALMWRPWDGIAIEPYYRGEHLDPTATARQSTHLQVKWFAHPAGDARPEWADPDACLSLSVLVDGDVRFDFRDVAGEERSVRLARRGDYVLWHGPTYAHSWRTDAGCTLLTVRWPVRADGAERASR